VVAGIETVYVDINKGVPQGTVLVPFLFSLMVNDIKPMDAQSNLLVKFADDITTSAPSLGPVYEFVCDSFRTGKLNCFRVK
jgi:hypothetical protein